MLKLWSSKSGVGLKDVCLSLLCVISEKGIVRVADGRMSDEERELLHNLAELLRKAVGGVRSSYYSDYNHFIVTA